MCKQLNITKMSHKTPGGLQSNEGMLCYVQNTDPVQAAQPSQPNTLIVPCMNPLFTRYVPSIYPLCTLYVPSIYLALRLTCGRISISHFQSASAPVLAGSSSTSSPSGRLVIHIAARVGGEFIDIERILQVG